MTNQNKPFTSAHVALIEGEQGSGKSNTGTARTITPAINNITGIINPKTGEYYEAKPIPKDEKVKIRQLGYKLSFDAVKIVKPDKSITISRIPNGFSIRTSLNIWCNYHLYGIEYHYINTWGELIKGLSDYTFYDGRLVVDEYHLGAGARDSLTALGKAMSKESFLLRRKRLDVDFIIPHQRLGEWTSRLVYTTRISCSYDENTRMITLIEKKGKEPTKEFSYYAPLYWKYYNTEEHFKQPSDRVAKAIAQGM